MDGESIRKGLKDVFGSFDDFCVQISNTGTSLSTRHGVVNQATPVNPRPNPFMSSRPHTPTSSSQSARACLQKMSELVEDTPLQPPNLATFSRDLYQDPSSSTRSAPDDTETRKTKRKLRNPDSDSEFERDNRKRPADYASKPGPSRTAQENDAMKELFGDDTSKPNGSEKGISPDSGVHSNEGSEETDIHVILSTMSNLQPMLSPVTERPQDRERERREREKRLRRDSEKKSKEGEKLEQKQREREEKERRRREEKRREEENERRAEKERIEADERERIKREAEERRREEDRAKKELEERQRREERQKREEEKRREEERLKREEEKKKAEEDRTRKEEKLRERQRKEEERLRKEEEERVKQEEQRKEDDRLRKEADDQERSRFEREQREEMRRFELLELQQQPLTETSNRLTGVLSLRNLSSDRMSQLLDMNRKRVRSENKGSRPSSPYVSKELERVRVEHEEKSTSEPESTKRHLEGKLDKNVPSPRPGTSKREFHCAGNECIPSRPTLPLKRKDSELNQGDAYQELARSKKRQADANEDQLRRILIYMECIVYFTLSANYYAIHERTGARHTSILRDTSKLLENVTNRFLGHAETVSPLIQHFTSRLRVLSIRAQAILGYHVFNYKMPSALKTLSIIEKSDEKCSFFHGEDQISAPGDGDYLNQDPSTSYTVSMPMEVYTSYKMQLKQLHGLMNAHKLWNESTAYISKSPADTLFINSLETICGALTIISPIDKLAIFLLTAVAWLRDEYELELKRPLPPVKASTKNS